MRLLALRAETMAGVRRLKLPCDDITPIGLWGSDMYLVGVNNEQYEVLRMWNVQTEDVTPATLRELHTDSPAIPTSPSAGNAASGARSSAYGAPSAARPTFVPPAARAVPIPPPLPKPAPATVSAPTPAPSAPIVSQPVAASVPASVPATAPAPVAVEAPAAGSAPTPSDDAPDASKATSSNDDAAVESTPERHDPPTLTLESNGGTVSREVRPDDRDQRSKGSRSEPEVKPSPAKDGKESSAGKLRMTVDGEHLYAEIKGGKIVLKDRTYDSLAHARDSIRRERNKVAVWEYFDEGVKAWRVLNRD
jgi:hypothetical protein